MSAGLEPSEGGGPSRRPMKKNAFLLFCEEKRMELEAKGEKFPNGMQLQDLIQLGSPYWEKMLPEERAPFVERARLLRENPNAARSVRKAPPPPRSHSDNVVDWGSELVIAINQTKIEETQGPKKKIESQYQKLKTALEMEEADRNAIYKSLFTSVMDEQYKVPGPMNRKFLFIHVGTYVSTKFHILPAEFCIAEFNIVEGLIECHGAMIDPGAEQIPLGYMSDVMDARKRCGYAMPGYNRDCDPYKDCLAHIIKLVRKNEVLAEEGNAKELVHLYTMPENLEDVSRSLHWIMDQTGHTGTMEYSLKCVQTLMEVLLAEADRVRCENKLGRVTEVAQRKFEVYRLLKNLDYLYGAEVACEHHQTEKAIEKMQACSMHKVKSWVFNFLKHAAPLFNVIQVTDKHYPRFSDGIEYDEVGEIRRRLKPVSKAATLAEPLKTPAGCSAASPGAVHAIGLAARTNSDVLGSGEVLQSSVSVVSPTPVLTAGELHWKDGRLSSIISSGSCNTLEGPLKKEVEAPKPDPKPQTLAEMLRVQKQTEFMQPFGPGKGRGRSFDKILQLKPGHERAKGRGHPIPPWFPTHRGEDPFSSFDCEGAHSDRAPFQFMMTSHVNVDTSVSEGSTRSKGKGQFIPMKSDLVGTPGLSPACFPSRNLGSRQRSNSSYEGSRSSVNIPAEAAGAKASQGRSQPSDATTGQDLQAG